MPSNGTYYDNLGSVIVDRDTQKPDIIYALNDNSAAFVTPDGIGRYYYDNVDDAEDSHPDALAIVYVDDWEE